MVKENNQLREICRTCAENHSEKIFPLFNDGNTFLIKFIHNKEYCIKITKDDGLPQNICSKCRVELSRLNNFLIKCEKSEKIFKKITQANSLSTISEFKEIDELKNELNSDDGYINNYYYNLDNQGNSLNEEKTTELIIEELSPTNIEIKLENESTNVIFTEKAISQKYNIEEENTMIIRTETENQNLLKSFNINNMKEMNVCKTILPTKRINNDKKRDKFKCSVCNETFENESDFGQHKKLHQEIKKIVRQTFLCDLCGKEFVRQETLKDHRNAHLGIRPYKCEICEKTFSLKNVLRAHVTKHSSKREKFSCEICGRVFKTKSYYHDHLKRHEKGVLLENNEKPFKCPHCPKSFKLLSTLTAHCFYHNKTSDKKYHCSECNTTFKRSDHLKEHINGVHLKIFPFKCDICLKSFVTGAIRNAHVKKFHSGIRHKCNLCEKDFSLLASLSRHKRRHNDDKRFICEICNMSFMAVYQIERHMETHKIDETTKNSLISQTYKEITKTVVDTIDKSH